MPDYYLLSAQNINKWPGQAAAIEFEDLLVECCDATLLAPTMTGLAGPRQVKAARKLGVSEMLITRDRDGRRGRRGASRLLETPFHIDVPPRRTSGEQVLIIVGISLNFLPPLLAGIPDWRSRFDVVCAYIFDAFPLRSELAKPAWKRRLSPFTQAISSLDRMFIPMPGSAQTLSDLYGVPVTVVPMGCDVVKFGHPGTDRPIDVMGYGRQHPEHSQVLADTYNDPASPRIYYHTDAFYIELVTDFHRYRRFFWKTLTRSRIALAYDALTVNPGGRFPFSFVSLRWFESITAGCLIVGRRPTSPEMDEMFFWEDSTLEVPEATDQIVPFMEDLLRDTDRLDAAHRRNHAHAMAHHDLRYRIADMVDALGFPRPDPLERNLDLVRQESRKLGLEPRA